MLALASVDGVITALEDATVPVLDRGFLYGDAVFEALRTYGGKPHALEAHLSRLYRSAGLIGIDPDIAQAEFAEEVARAIAALDVPERYVRIVLTRGEGTQFGLSLRHAQNARRVIVVRPLEAPPRAVYERGIRLESVVSPVARSTAGAKPTAYLTNLLALEEAEKRGAQEALLIGDFGQLLEGATSSVFLIRENTLLTPPLALGILPGITRGLVMDVASRAGLVARERLLTIQDAYRADEVVITSSIREVIPVVAIDGICIGQGTPGPLSAALLRAYRDGLA